MISLTIAVMLYCERVADIAYDISNNREVRVRLEQTDHHRHQRRITYLWEVAKDSLTPLEFSLDVYQDCIISKSEESI